MPTNPKEHGGNPTEAAMVCRGVLPACSTTFLLLFAASWCIPKHSATAFAPPSVRTPAGRCSARALSTAADTSDADKQQLPLPPRDETFNPFAMFKELQASPDVLPEAERFDRVGRKTGGIWRSMIIGFLPSTVVTAQQGSKWMVQEEGAENLYQSFPTSVTQVLGEKALISVSEQPKLHAIGRKPMSQALSPKAVLELQPVMASIVDDVIARLEGYAKSGQEVVLHDELRIFTLEAIAVVFFGDYVTPELMGNIKRYLPDIVDGLFSIPFRLPLILNRLPVLAFGKAMNAREEFKDAVLEVLAQRRADLADGKVEKTAAIFDSFLEIQQRQMGLEGQQGDVFDDDFIYDNVVLSMFAGTDTTAVTLTRILQLLATAEDGIQITHKLLEELTNTAKSDDDELDSSTESGSRGASRPGILQEFPLLDAVILEAFRLHPTVPGLFRKTRKDVNYNGYLIPKGKTVNFNFIHGLRAKSLYPVPQKFCPFRFLHADKDKEPEQPIPPMFGVGRHMCPGRELAKLEILLFLKSFLTKFDYQLVEGQSVKGVLPANAPEDKLRVVLKVKASP